MQWDLFFKVVVLVQLFLINVFAVYYLMRRRFYDLYNRDGTEQLMMTMKEQSDRNRMEFRDLFNALEKQDFKSFFHNVDRFEYVLKRLEVTSQRQVDMLNEISEQQKQVDGIIHSSFLSLEKPASGTLEDKLKIITTVTSDVAHTLKTPLSGIKVSLELLKKELDGGGTDRIATLESGVRMLEETIAGYSQLGLMPTGTNHQELISLPEGIESTFKILALSTNKKVNLRFSIPENILVPRELYRYLIIPLASILQNAFDAVTDNGIINVSVIENQRGLEITIHNNGPLIDQGQDIYARGVSTKNSSGLGLTVAKEVVETALKGTLSHQNESNGVTFKVEVPRLSYGE